MSDIQAVGAAPPPGVMRTPRSVDVEITAHWNVRCTYCYFFDNPEVNYQDLPTETWLHFFDECGQMGVMDLTLVGGEPFPNGGRLTGCGSHSNKIAIRADGAIVPCNMLDHMMLGWIGEDSLLEVWQHSLALNGMRSRHEIPLSHFDFCEGCEYIPYCTGNCPALAYSMLGEVNHPSPDACLRRFLEQGGSLEAVMRGA